MEYLEGAANEDKISFGTNLRDVLNESVEGSLGAIYIYL